MRRSEIDCARLTGRDEAHEYLRAALAAFSYRGNNLDALHDVLTSLPGEIRLSRVAEVAGYARRVLRVVRDARAENPGLIVREDPAPFGAKIGVGTFIVREDAGKDPVGTLRRLREIGYEGAEFLGFFGLEPRALRAALEEMGLEALGDHVPVEEFLKDPARCVEDHLAAGCRRVTLACSKERAGSEPFEALAESFAAAAEICLEDGIVPMYHNHDFDMRGDAPFAQRVLDAVPALRFEPDVGWMAVAGKDPARYLEMYRARIPVVHLKDVLLYEGGFSFRPTGYGVVNTPALLSAILACEPEWLMVDHDDAYGRDRYEDLALSFHYVKALCAIRP